MSVSTIQDGTVDQKNSDQSICSENATSKMSEMQDAPAFQEMDATNTTCLDPKRACLDPKQVRVCETIAQRKNVVVLGAAGTGKSFTVRRAISGTIYWICPTGMLACAYSTNGMTLHQFCGFMGPRDISRGAEGATLAKKCGNRLIKNGLRDRLLREKPVIVLEEISMWPIAHFEFLNSLLKIVVGSGKLFGGLQVVCLGDHAQLPPVIKHARDPYEFSAFFSELMSSFTIIELTTLHRQLSTLGDQSEEDLDGRRCTTNVLQGIRRGEFGPDFYGMVTYRRRHSLKNAECRRKGSEIIMAYRRQAVRDINERILESLPGEYITVVPFYRNGDSLVDINTKKFKEGCEIIFTRKIRSMGSNPCCVVNGTRGILNYFSGSTKLSPDTKTFAYVTVEGTEGEGVHKFPMSITKSAPLSKSAGVVHSIEMPFQNGPAITVHKLQGATLDSAVMLTHDITKDISLLYVALSRFKNLMNATLVGPTIHPSQIGIPEGRKLLDKRVEELTNKI